MAACGRLADEVGIALGGHTEHEEGGPHAELVEQRQHGLGLALERRPASIPVGTAEAPVDELVPVLEVDAQQEHGAEDTGTRIREALPRLLLRARRRLPARRDGGRLRGHAGAEARAEPGAGPANHEDLLAGLRVRPRTSALVSFKLRKGDRATLEVVDADGDVVRTLFRGPPLRAGAARGRLGRQGRRAAASFPTATTARACAWRDAHRTITFPNEMRVDTERPRIERFSVSRRVISPDGDGRADGVSVSYRLNERAHAIRLLVNGKQRGASSVRRRPRAVQWFGRFRGRVRAARHVPARRSSAVDDAGNRSERVPAGTGARALPRARPRPHLAPRRNALRCARPHRRPRLPLAASPRGRGRSTARYLVLRAPRKPGRYRLFVERERPRRLGARRGDGRRAVSVELARLGAALGGRRAGRAARRAAAATPGSRVSQRSPSAARCSPATSCRAARRSCSRRRSSSGSRSPPPARSCCAGGRGSCRFAALACVPARIPVDVGDTEANLLLPLYAVIAAAGAALAWSLFRGEGEARELGPGRLAAGRLRRVRRRLALRGATTRGRARSRCSSSCCPFGVLAVCLARLPWRRVPVGYALRRSSARWRVSFAAIGVFQWITRDVFWNPKVIVGNAYAPFYRVNSVFWDPVDLRALPRDRDPREPRARCSAGRRAASRGARPC